MGIVKRNRHAVLVNTGDTGYWLILRMDNGKRIRLFAGGTPDKGNRVFNWHNTKGK